MERPKQNVAKSEPSERLVNQYFLSSVRRETSNLSRWRHRFESRWGCKNQLMQTPTDSELRSLYDLQVRRNTTPDASGSFVDWSPSFVRWTANGGLGWSEISWAKLDEATANEIIATQINFFNLRRQSFVWRVHDYDQPSDLGSRLLDAGFSHTGSSALLVAVSASFKDSSALPEGIELIRVKDVEGVDLLIRTHEEVFGHSHQVLRRSILARRRNAPSESEMFVVTANDAPICSARIEFLPNRDFATLWGGGTIPEWRGRGLYRALVFQRAQMALARGYKYLSVLASDQSRPILNSPGFEVISTVSTYSWEPPRNA
jgi:GNAT superfamily N-acetyltransferase